MDDYQILIYIVFIVLYFLSRVLRKKKPVIPADSEQDEHQEETSGSKPTTFKDLLRELEGRSQEEPEFEIEEAETKEPVKEPEPEPSYPRYETYATLDKKEQTNPEYDKYLREGGLKSLDEQVGLDAPTTRVGAYIITTKENIQTASRYRKMLKDPVSIKDAIILREILDRKEF